MARKDILPGYISQQAWVDLCDAIDIVFSTRVDMPASNLGKLRRTNIINQSGLAKIQSNLLLSSTDDLDVFEKPTLIKQVNSSGITVPEQGYYSSQEFARLFRNLPKFWYSKGSGSVADFISYVFGIPITFRNQWTQDYVTFLPEGDPGIGTPIYNGGTWYPTTHVNIEVEAFSLPGGIPLELFAKFIEELINYPIVPVYTLTIPVLWLSTTAGNFIDAALGNNTLEEEILANFTITHAADETVALGGGGFETITGIAIPGTGGSGFVTPTAMPTADFTYSVVGLTVTVTSTSTGYQTAYSWDFTGDSLPDSGLASTSWTYSSSGPKVISLTVSNPYGYNTKFTTITL